MTTLRDMDMEELLDEFNNFNSNYRFEGADGVHDFAGVVDALGYKMHNGRLNAIHDFLADNPGAIEALIQWIGKQNFLEWKESIIKELEDNEYECPYDEDGADEDE